MAHKLLTRRVVMMAFIGISLASLEPHSSFAGGSLIRKRYWPRNVIRAIQIQLKKRNFEPGPIDGLYGPMTAKAIAAFQRKNRMYPDGRISNALLDALDIN